MTSQIKVFADFWTRWKIPLVKFSSSLKSENMIGWDPIGSKFLWAEPTPTWGEWTECSEIVAGLDLDPELDHYWGGGVSLVKHCPGSGRSAQAPSAGPMIRSLPARPHWPHLSQCHCGYTEPCVAALRTGTGEGWGQGEPSARQPVSDCECGVWQGALWQRAEPGWGWGCHEPLVWTQVTSWPPGSHQTCHHHQ